MDRNFEEYHKSIGAEMNSIQDRIRNLIGGSHWPTDGGYKETIVRKTLRNHLPASVSVGHGFICYPEGNSHQIDILLIRTDKPRIFQDGELSIVTADAVEAIIEVKTRQHHTQLQETLGKLSEDVKKIRENGSPNCKAGLFVHNGGNRPEQYTKVLGGLADAAKEDKKRVVNWVAHGNDSFYRFWEKSQFYSPQSKGAWHAYNLKGLAQAYFVSNVIWGLSGSSETQNSKFAWFPLTEGKEIHLKGHQNVEKENGEHDSLANKIYYSFGGLEHTL